MVRPAGNKAKRLISANHSVKAIHHQENKGRDKYASFLRHGTRRMVKAFIFHQVTIFFWIHILSFAI